MMYLSKRKQEVLHMSDLCANSSVPLYCQLASKIQEDIYSGILKPDEQIPPEFDLSEMYQVSRSTVRKAIAKLVSDDLLIKIHGKGTFVAPPRIKRKAVFASSTKDWQHSGKKLTNRVLETTIIEPNSSEYAFFELTSKNDRLISMHRTRSLSGEPICVETILFSTRHAFMMNEDISGSLYELLEKKYQLYPSTGYRTFEICYATKEEADFFSVPRGSSLMLIRDYVKDQNGVPLHISKNVYLGNKGTEGIEPVQIQFV